MKRRLIKIGRSTLKVLIPFILLIFILDACMQFRLSNQKIEKKFKDLPQQVRVDTYSVDGYTLRYLDVGEEEKPMVLFAHGSPGSSKDFIRYLQDTQLAGQFRMVAVDRPGYGYSNFGQSLTSIEKQAAYIAPLLDLNQHEQPVILVGYSYGGPVVARLAMDFPDKAHGPMLMLAPALDPSNEKLFFFNKPFNSKALKWTLPRAFKVANDEKITHAAELQLMQEKWDSLTNRAVFMHGYADRIVPIANSKFASEAMIAADVDTIFPKKMNHFLIWNRYEEVKAKLLEIADELQ